MWLVALVAILFSSVNGDDHMTSRDDVHNIIAHRCCPSDACYPDQEALAALHHSLDGQLLLPSDSRYANESHMYNTLEQRFPNAIAIAKSASDIQKVVMFARKHNLHLTVRSSGHDYAGRSTWEGSFLLNLAYMDEIDINLQGTDQTPHGTVRVQTGIQWKEIYMKLNDLGRVIVGGSAHTVTPGGYTLGGGHSPLSRSLGYAVDNLLEAQVVLADGSIAVATPERTVITSPEGNVKYDETGDFFWALRGGGGSTFGVAVSFLFKLHPMPTGMVVFSTYVPLEIPKYLLDYYNEVMTGYEQILHTLPSNWGGYWILSNVPASFPENGQDTYFKGSFQLFMNKFGPWDGTEEDTFSLMTDWLKSKQIPYSFENKTDFWDYEQHAQDPPITRSYLANTLLHLDLMGEEFRTFIHEHFFEGGYRDQYRGCTGVLLGGKTTEGSLASTPLHPGYRSAVTSLSCGVTLADTSLPLLNQTAWNGVVIESFKPFAAGLRQFGHGMYLNEPWKDNPYWKEDFWGTENYERLLTIKHRYDPDNFFTCHHCVGSDLETDEDKTRPDYTSSANKLITSLPAFAIFCLVLSMFV